MLNVDSSAILSLLDVRFGFATCPAFLGPIKLSIGRGECWAIVGPNGAGKSTLLRLMAGLYTPDSGEAYFGGRRLTELSGRDRARGVAFVPQHPSSEVDFTVRDVVLMGRFPYRSFGLFESAQDHRIAEQAMEVTKTAGFADRPMATLSGGEAQRVHVAAALAQQPLVMLLDEPTASLDLQHQLAVFEILRDRTDREELAVVVVTHDVNLAAQYCSHVLLLDGGRSVATGSPEEVLTPALLGPVYGVELATLTTAQDSTRRWVVPVQGGQAGQAGRAGHAGRTGCTGRGERR